MNMIHGDDAHLLFLHPGVASPTPVIDALTRRMAGAWKAREDGGREWRGFHCCTGCDAESDNRDHYVVTVKGERLLTNSLAIHYLAFHRSDVPRAELEKVKRLVAEPVDPPTKWLRPRWYSDRHAR